MRDLLFKAITSNDRMKKKLSSSEILENQGVRSVVRRHFVCSVKEVNQATSEKPLPSLYVLKEINHKNMQEKFFCRMKGCVYVLASGKLYMVAFLHSLKINLIASSGVHL
jgi:hypothetical protein